MIGKLCALGWIALMLLGVALPARAQFAVVDVGAIAQLIEEVRLLEEQLAQAERQLDSMRGGRGMESLLAGTTRNYLPTNWAELTATLDGAAGAYGALATQINAAVTSNAVLSASQLAALSPAERRELQAARHSAALLQALTRQALDNTSARFAALQQLIDAIGGAADQKAILDLQARIQAEQGMLVNESTKLTVLYQSAQAEEWARRQRQREQIIAGFGSLRRLPPVGLR